MWIIRLGAANSLSLQTFLRKGYRADAANPVMVMRELMDRLLRNVRLAVIVLTALIMGGGYLIAGPQGLKMALIIAAIMNFIGYFFSDKIALASMHAQEVGPEHELYRIVEDLTRRANLPMPRV